MTERDPIQCDACRDMITELACGELNSRDETRVRAHAEHCETCSKALLGFQQVIWAASEAELDEPSEGLDARILAAAEAALQTRRSGAKGNAGASAVRPAASGLGRWLTSPQFAIAAVVLVVAGLGVRAMRTGEAEHAALAPAQSSPAAAAPSPSPTATGAIAPVAVRASEPKAAESKQTSPRAASPEKRETPLGPSESPFVGGAASGAAEAARSERMAEKPGVQNSTRTADDTLAQAPAARKRSAAATASPVEAPGAAPPSAEGSRGTADLEAVAADQAPAKVDAPVAVAPAAAEPPTAEPAGRAETGNAPAVSASPAPAAPAATASPAPAAPAATATTAAAPPRPISERADLSRGIQALSAGKTQQAIVILFPLARNGSDEVRDLAQTLLAEALHDAGRCQDAIVWFNRVVARPSASRKSLELAADCFAKTGKDAKAEELRKRAQGR